MPSLQLLALAANVVLIVVCLLVGGRLVRLSTRTRQLPEFLLGASFILSALAVAASLLAPMFGAESGAGLLTSVSRWLIALAVGLVLYLAQRIFRPKALWARAAVVVGVVLLAMSALSTAYPPGSEPAGSNLMFWLGRVGLVLPYAWAGVEAYLFQRDLRRRAAIGLAPDDFMATRLALWSVGLALSAALYGWIAVVVAARWYFDLDLPILFTGFVFGLPIAICIWLAFFPPSSWMQASRTEGDEAAGDSEVGA